MVYNFLRVLIFSSLIILLSSCSLTLGPQVETKAIIVKSGTPIEILEQVSVNARILTETDGEVSVFKQDVGGWITMHPDHWKSLKAEINNYRLNETACKQPKQ